jgi:hypothetical protein
MEITINAGQLRRTLRAANIVVGVLLSIYVYSPLHADPLLTDIIRYLAIPVIALSGVAMWQQGRISRWTARRSIAVSRA